MVKQTLHNNYYIAFFCLIIFFVFSGCKKLDTSGLSDSSSLGQSAYDRFFNTNRTRSEKEEVFVNYIKRINNKENFVGKTVAQIGYPY